MNITVVGSGYVGLVSGACFSEMGNNVTCVDIDQHKINELQNGNIPIYEPGLVDLIKRNIQRTYLKFSTSLSEALTDSEVVFIAVGTPMGEDGSADLKSVLQVASEIGRAMPHSLIVVNKSTVPVGTAMLVSNTIKDQLKKRDVNHEVTVVSNPEFLKEGAAINDFMKPDRIVVGVEDKKAEDIMRKLYSPFTMNRERFIIMDIRSAELTKYAANAMLATKISFMNEISNIAEQLGADINNVRIGIGSDSRIGYSFIYPGCGYGGSCFPKDVKALIKMAKDADLKADLVNAVEIVNQNQKRVIVEKIKNHFGSDLSNKTFAVWGLSFKPETDDMREAPSLTILNELTSLGATIKAYDPKAMDEAKNFYFKNNNSISYYNNKMDVLEDSEALILITEWKEFRSPNFEKMKSLLKNPVIFDGRNQYSNYQLEDLGITYYQIGKK